VHPGLKRKLVIVASVVAVAAFGGGAYAATRDSSATGRKAFIEDVAKRLNVPPAQVTSTLDEALVDQLKAAVALSQSAR
jgi:hypothetical protein